MTLSLTPEELAERLRAFLCREAAAEVEVGGVRPLAGGASRAAYAVDVDVRGGASPGRHRCVLRLDLGGTIYEASLSRLEEAAVIGRAREQGVLAPRVLWGSDDPEVLGRDFVLMERVDGETIGRKIVARPDLEAARAALPEQLGSELARIHAAAYGDLTFLPRPAAGESCARAALRRVRGELDRAGGFHPAIELGLRWLEMHAPDCPRPVLVHGDFRLGNVVVGTSGLAAILDWEFAAVGDPHEDLAWPFVRDWRFRREDRRFAGISDGEDFLQAYEEQAGRKVDRAALRYHEVFGNLRWAVGCLTQAQRHLSGEEPSVELASLGRRAAEMELEMMERIEEAERCKTDRT